ncbi:hypothetical protein [Gordonia crocea]|uniref:Outer membrane protein n=1 Tax=Gordonia crocea TaxID=589162 RepID=A0A7I9V2U3_9ACTN|nr:hypothetical protein [Gordonia crocea]GED99369.1 hypothetical protein nbrc107697_34080 [Gordonia crocea]
MTAPGGPVRTRERDAALRRWRSARIAAGPALRRRAQQRRARLLVGLRAAVVVATLAVVAVIVMAFVSHRDTAATERGEQAQAAARSALTTMLTADPAKAQAYADAVLAVTTGEQRRRIEAGRAELVGEIARQTGPSTGQVLSVTLVDEPRTDGDVTVLVVAEATNPQLIGADTTAKRIPVVVTMSRVDGHWLVAKARQA